MGKGRLSSYTLTGHSAILDAALLEEEQRTEALSVARRSHCPVVIVEIIAPGDIFARTNNAKDAGPKYGVRG